MIRVGVGVGGGGGGGEIIDNIIRAFFWPD